MALHELSVGVGLRQVWIGPRDDDGLMTIPAATVVGTAYAGVQAKYSRALVITPSDVQRIVAAGDDRPFHTFLEAPTDVPTGELRTQISDTALIALITGVTEFGSDPAKLVPLSTDKLGDEDNLIIWGSRKSVETGSTSFGARKWETYFLPNVRAAAFPHPWEISTIGEFRWTLALNMSTVDPWGRTLAVGTHGCTEAAWFLLKTRYQPFFDYFEGDGAETEFQLTKGALVKYNTPLISSIVSCVDGVMTGVTVDAAGLATFAGAPADGAHIAIQYEYE